MVAAARSARSLFPGEFAPKVEAGLHYEHEFSERSEWMGAKCEGRLEVVEEPALTGVLGTIL